VICKTTEPTTASAATAYIQLYPWPISSILLRHLSLPDLFKNREDMNKLRLHVMVHTVSISWHTLPFHLKHCHQSVLGSLCKTTLRELCIRAAHKIIADFLFIFTYF